MTRSWIALLLAAGVSASPAQAEEEGRLKEVASVTALDVGRLEPGPILFSDRHGEEIADPATGLMRFEDWARARPAEKAFLSLYPTYEEPTVNVTVHGVTKPREDKLQMYVAGARFVLARPAEAIDLSRYATLALVERMDPAIKHHLIGPEDAVPNKDPDSAFNKRPDRPWCEPKQAVCIASRYDLEGKLPLGVRLANKLEEGGKKIAEFLEFQGELRAIPAADLDQAGLAKLTGVATPVSGALEQSIFHVNQIMRFGKFLAVFQPHPADPKRTVVTAFMALGIKASVLDRKKEFERIPVMRNLVPAQVLVGKSSFNTGTSISAGLPSYTRNRVEALAGILARE